MAKIIRGPSGPALRDDTGRYTAISFSTNKGEVWISNRALALAFGFIFGLVTFAGSAEVSSAKTVLFDWALRLNSLN